MAGSKRQTAATVHGDVAVVPQEEHVGKDRRNVKDRLGGGFRLDRLQAVGRGHVNGGHASLCCRRFNGRIGCASHGDCLWHVRCFSLVCGELIRGGDSRCRGYLRAWRHCSQLKLGKAVRVRARKPEPATASVQERTAQDALGRLKHKRLA